MYKPMTEYEATIKKWGNSFGILVPREIIQESKLKEESRVRVILLPRGKIVRETFGMLKGLKLTGQQVKNDARRELY